MPVTIKLRRPAAVTDRPCRLSGIGIRGGRSRHPRASRLERLR